MAVYIELSVKGSQYIECILFTWTFAIRVRKPMHIYSSMLFWGRIFYLLYIWSILNIAAKLNIYKSFYMIQYLYQMVTQ